jgi:pimeloyl-ACP methyl ester carboxylesterase
MGISFSGGLSVAAAGRAALRGKVAFAFALGGHGDLERVLRFLCTGVDADGSSRRPHDYGLAVILLSLAPRLVPDDQVGGLVRGTENFLLASALDHVKDPRALDRFEQARRIARELPEPAAGLLHLVNTRDVETLGARLLPHVSVLAIEPSVSPERVPPPSAPVFLLHGTDDTVIPAEESVRLGRHLDQRGGAAHVLLSPLITHAEVEHPPDLVEAWRLIAFWKDVLHQ